MCGIFGYFGKGNPDKLAIMMEALKSRGPDSQGTVFSENLNYGIGHTRLAIIDLSERANQPMSNQTDDVNIVFNGEIYNYRQLKQTLLRKGYAFKSDSDTEVILNCYIEFGDQCFELFEGMFSIAIVDRRMVSNGGHPKFFLARDSFGIKPLYYAVADEVLYFASEIQALRKVLGSSLQLDNLALDTFLSMGSIVKPNSIDQRIKALGPATIVQWIDGRLESTIYWNLSSKGHEEVELAKGRNSNENVNEIRSRLISAISMSTVSDTPIALMLSGGVDSVSLASILHQNKMVNFDAFFLRAFLTGPDDEFEVVKNVATSLDLKLHIVEPSENILDSFFSWIRNMDQPSVDGFNVWLLSREIAKTHKVAITGAGGDEVFAGYPHHRLPRFLQLRRPNFFNDLFLSMLNNLRPNRYSLSLINKYGTPDLIWHSVRNLRKLSKYIDSFDHKMQLDQMKSEDDLQYLQRLDLERYLVNTILADSDVASMAHGLELRPAYLNKKLVQYVYRVPASQKIDLTINKPLLISAVNDQLVESIGNIKKRGFELPYVAWMKNQLKPAFIDLIGSLDRNVIDYRLVDSELLKLRRNKPDTFTWALGILGAWLMANQE